MTVRSSSPSVTVLVKVMSSIDASPRSSIDCATRRSSAATSPCPGPAGLLCEKWLIVHPVCSTARPYRRQRDAIAEPTGRRLRWAVDRGGRATFERRTPPSPTRTESSSMRGGVRTSRWRDPSSSVGGGCSAPAPDSPDGAAEP